MTCARRGEPREGICLTGIRKQLTMAKFRVYKSFLAAPYVQSVMAGLQIVQHVRAFVCDASL